MKENQKFAVIEETQQSHIICQEVTELLPTDDTPRRNIFTVKVA